MKNILVTGNDGYIGSVLVPLLVGKGYLVTGLDTFYYSKPQKQVLFNQLVGDVRGIDSIDLSKFDAIIHLAALSNDPTGALNEGLTEDINFKATVALARKAKRSGVKRFIFSSSCSVYGISDEPFVDESSTVKPLTAYAKSKILSEQALSKLTDATFDVVLMRNSTVYGYAPRFRDDLVINNLTACAYTTKMLKVMSDGSPWRPLINVRDLSDIFEKLLHAELGEHNGKPINIGFDEGNHQVKEIVDKIGTQVVGCKIIYTGEHGADTRSYRVKFARLREVLPNVEMEWTIEKSIADLLVKFKEIGLTKTEFENHRYTRIHEIQLLLDSGRLTTNLEWSSL